MRCRVDLSKTGLDVNTKEESFIIDGQTRQWAPPTAIKTGFGRTRYIINDRPKNAAHEHVTWENAYVIVSVAEFTLLCFEGVGYNT